MSGFGPEVLDGFVNHLVRQGCSTTTAALYYGCVRRAVTHRAGPLAIMDDEVLSKGRRETYRKALLHFASWRGDATLEATVREHKLPGKGRKRLKPKQVPNLDEWRNVRRTILTGSDPLLRSVLYLLATTGLRVERELLSVTKAQLEEVLLNGRSLLEQKSGTWRYLVLPQDEQLTAARVLVQALPRGDVQVWEVLRTDRRRSRKSVAEYLRRELTMLGESLGLPLSPHVLRHAFLDAVYDETDGNLELVREAAGHSSTRTTRQYYQDRGHPETLERITARVLD
jgi:integrase